jgi:tetratricopeptide (TPR) repeat protein
VLLLLAAHALYAAPYIPTDDAVVLERTPAANASRQLAPLRQKLRTDRPDVSTALHLAEGYLRIARETADPRFTSYAEATIAPWLRASNPSAAVLTMQATILQSSHRFDASLAVLDRALQLDPMNAQAWLTKATVLQVQGKYAPARQACGQLLRTAGQLIAASCLANINSLNGRLEASYRHLQSLLPAVPAGDSQTRSWLLGQLAEMAVRQGDPLAEKYFLEALALLPSDVYLKAAYADLLLQQQRNTEVLALLRDNQAQDVLLLRLAIAASRLRTPLAQQWSDTFSVRYRAAQRGDDNGHLREYARFLLEVRGDAAGALQVARRNWQVQREPADVHVYVNAARAARRDAAEVWTWIRDTGYEDRALAPAPVKQSS